VRLILELGGWDYDNGISSVGEPTGQIHGSRAESRDELSQLLPNPTDDEIKKYRTLRRKMIIPKEGGEIFPFFSIYFIPTK
jgi:hypothetical protein